MKKDIFTVKFSVVIEDGKWKCTTKILKYVLF